MRSFLTLRDCLGLDRPDRLYHTHICAIRNGMSASDEKDLSNVAIAFVSAGGGVVGSTDYLVQQQASPNNTVLLNTGKAYVPTSDGTMVYATRMDATQNLTIGANSSGNPRIDSVVLYCDLAVSPDAAADNVAKFFDVQGTPAGSPVAPTNAQILAQIGSGNPYIVLATISVLNGFTSISSSTITDARAFAKISGGDSVFQSGFANYVSSGLTIPTSASLTTTATAGVLYYNGNKVAVASDNGHTYAASNDTYVDVSSSGVFTYNGVGNGAAAPGLTASSIRSAKVVTSGTAVTSVVQSGSDSLGNLIYPSSPLAGKTGGFQSGCSVYLSANQSIPNGVLAKATFDTKAYDLGTEFDATTNHRFTATSAGKYLVTFTPLMSSIVDGQALTGSIYKNGSAAYNSTFESTGTATNMGSSLVAIIGLAATDYLEFYVIQTDSVARNLAGGATNSVAMIQRLV
jgi:hypothetical protein